ncbi:hypothetical protein ACFC58_04270 [Kitasatospora purpeofusca]|uniref:hypothetical protein n=1 Tax=Kitasatospora purpeofusca TaxID=67352 RepID=UPI0035DB7FBF
MVVSPLSSARFPVPLEWGAPPAPEAVPAVRWLVGAIVREWGVPLADDVFKDVQLCASELIANALLHTGDRCAVTVLPAAGATESRGDRPVLRAPEAGARGRSDQWAWAVAGGGPG